ncbi:MULTISPECIES: cytochrome c [unclassified Caballeronia]|uniref:c-type cytochrome n=1 Tax=unclassified Caballeronia TaxID=2646786 RepID=UPI002859790E|nr:MULTISPECIES: cytochrome c [unclassified Caballeronia]MDR5753353.1 cytochrome c [Caballeronia sp. LZ024]MDR5841092.1 cytochrome c [Caballeronia sp. LZ031]
MISAAVIAACAVSTAGVAFAADVKAGRAKAVQCQACHGIDGLAKIPEAPNLAGQTEEYLVKALNDFKSGARQNDMMTLMAKPLTDADIANLAAYYHSLGKP